jgi:hypothetical protein
VKMELELELELEDSGGTTHCWSSKSSTILTNRRSAGSCSA